MTLLFRVASGFALGAAVGLLAEWLFSKPLVQSLVAVPLGWVVGLLATALMWFAWPDRAADTRAISVSVGLAEGTVSTLPLLALSAGLHAGLGWAGSAVHPALASHRAVVLGVLGGICGAMGFSVVGASSGPEN